MRRCQLKTLVIYKYMNTLYIFLVFKFFYFVLGIYIYIYKYKNILYVFLESLRFFFFFLPKSSTSIGTLQGEVVGSRAIMNVCNLQIKQLIFCSSNQLTLKIQ